ncbi:MAG: AI-2E family transporter [Caldilineales bacterium]|nr:AI-2E family transporter [Caldilineales bacterium]
MTTNSNPPTSTPPPWPYSLRLFFLAIWLAVGLAAFLLARPFWWLLALAGIAGFLLQPLVGLLRRLWIPRGIASLIVILLLLVLVILTPVGLTLGLIESLGQIRIDVKDLSAYINDLAAFVQRLPEILPAIHLFGFTIDLLPYYRQIQESVAAVQPSDILNIAQSLVGVVVNVLRSAVQVVSVATIFATNVIGRAVGLLISLILLLLLTFYAINDLPRARAAVLDLAPIAYQAEWEELWRRTGSVWNRFFRGQIILSLVMGGLVWLGLTILGVPGALALGVLTGVLEVIPTLGPVLATIPAVLLALLQGSTAFPDLPNSTIALIVLGFYVALQQIENLILVPRIMGRSVGIHPLLLIIAVLVFTVHLGVFGAFIATPALASLLVWFAYFHARMVGRTPYPALAPPPAIPAVASADDSSAPRLDRAAAPESQPTLVLLPVLPPPHDQVDRQGDLV